MTLRHIALAALGLAALAGCHQEPAAVSPSGPRVVFLDGRPVAGAHVRVTGIPDQVTGDDGVFTVAGAPATYDVAVTWYQTGILYEGIGRRDPVVTLPFFMLVSQDQWGSARGTCAGLTAGRDALVTIASPDSVAWATAPQPDGTWSLGVGWVGPESIPAVAHLLEWIPDATGLPAEFTAHARAGLQLEANYAQVEGVALSALPVASAPIAVQFAPERADPVQLELWVSWPEGGVSRVAGGAVASGGTTVAAADVPDASWAVLARRGVEPAAWGWRSGLSAGASSLTVDVPDPAVLTAPAPGQLGIGLSTDFSWTAPPGTVHLLTFWPTSTTVHAPVLAVVTTRTSARIPDFGWASDAYVPPAGMEYAATLDTIGPCANIDEAVAWRGVIAGHPRYWDSFFGNLVPPDGFASEHRITFTMQ